MGSRETRLRLCSTQTRPRRIDRNHLRCCPNRRQLVLRSAPPSVLPPPAIQLLTQSPVSRPLLRLPALANPPLRQSTSNPFPPSLLTASSTSSDLEECDLVAGPSPQIKTPVFQMTSLLLSTNSPLPILVSAVVSAMHSVSTVSPEKAPSICQRASARIPARKNTVLDKFASFSYVLTYSLTPSTRSRNR